MNSSNGEGERTCGKVGKDAESRALACGAFLCLQRQEMSLAGAGHDIRGFFEETHSTPKGVSVSGHV